MTADRQRRVSELFHAAHAREAGERAAYLAVACGEDAALRREVESLLACDSEAAPFLEAPALEVAAGLVDVLSASAAPLIGRHIGTFEVDSLIGAGGMGTVYRAHDTRLGRDVALKILPAELTSDPARRARFEREARVLATLNHPYIAAIYGVADAEDLSALVLELVDGGTLADRLAAGPLPVAQALTLARQIAEALAVAHDKGIVHRDLKPANVGLTTAGSVKVLDFGLAKAVAGEALGPTETPSVTGSAGRTRDGMMLGTPAYMSPQQTRGEPAGTPSDIWAFGCLLYEMLSGRPPFEGATVRETLAAIDAREPDWSLLPASLPASVRHLVQRCLDKDPRRRPSAIADAGIAIEKVQVSRDRSRQRWTWAALALALAMTVSGYFAWQTPAPAFEQLTFRRGRIGGVRFVSNANSVVYSEARQGSALEVWWLDLADSPVSRSLAFAEGSDVLAARAGELALSLRRRFVLGERFVGTLAIAPVVGGPPKEVAENIEDADWDAAGKQLAVVRSSGDVAGQSQIEFPLNRILYQTPNSIRFLRVSRDGQRIAFLEDPTGRGVMGRVAVVDLKGTVTMLTEPWEGVRGLAWAASGDEIWFTAGDQRMNRSLRAVSLAGKQRVVLEVPGSLTLWDIAPDGRVLLTRDEERRVVVGVPPGETTERDLSWLDNSGVADISEDGKSFLLADRFGVYVRGMDGSPPKYLGLKDAFADDLSPDGKTVLATTTSTNQLVLVPTGPGNAHPLPAHAIVSYQGARWFPDGRRILFTGREAKGGLRSYVQDVNGGAPRALTPENTRALAISPDGELTAATGLNQGISIFPVAGGPSRPVPGSVPGDRPVAWSTDGSLWLFRRGEIPADIFRLDIATGKRHLWKRLMPPDPVGVYSIIEFQITSSGNAYVYGYTRLLSQLYLVRNLK